MNVAAVVLDGMLERTKPPLRGTTVAGSTWPTTSSRERWRPATD